MCVCVCVCVLSMHVSVCISNIIPISHKVFEPYVLGHQKKRNRVTIFISSDDSDDEHQWRMRETPSAGISTANIYTYIHFIILK